MRGQVGSVLSNNAKMAATTTADMKSRHRQLGRPPKCDTDKRQRQQEAYKKRDASRVYLASSYDRWKRLGGKLGLKDSSLAWHLMEAHATNCDECGLTEDNEEGEIMEQNNPSLFFSALVRCIHKLCHRHYTFGDCVQVVGLICLEVDNGKKENFSIREMVHKPFMLHLAKNNNNSTKHLHNFDTKQNVDVSVDSKDDSMNSCEDIKDKNHFSDNEGGEMMEEYSDHEQDQELNHSDIEMSSDFESNNGSKKDRDVEGGRTEFGGNSVPGEAPEDTVELNKSNLSEEKDSSFISVGNEEFNVAGDVTSHSSDPSSLSPLTVLDSQSEPPCHAGTSISTTKATETECSNKQQLVVDSLKSTRSCSDILTDVGTISQSKNMISFGTTSACTSYEITSAFKDSRPTDILNDKEASPNANTERENQIMQATVENGASGVSPALSNQDLERNEMDENEHMDDADHNNQKDNILDQADRTTSCSDNSVKHRERTDGEEGREEQDRVNSPVGLDLSIVKTEQQDYWQNQKHENLSKSGNRKRKSSEMDSADRENGSTFSPSYLNGNTRREIVYKVEYEHLEKNPFCDFYELTSHYPNIQQRTFYRWKRKIKDEFIFLEQNSDMTYEQFSKCIPHAKEEVFEIWKHLIKGGHRFSTIHVNSSETSPSRHSGFKKSENQSAVNTSLSLLQMYPHMSYQEFSYNHPMIPLEVFSSYKQQVLAAISYVEKNPSLEFSDLKKHFSFVMEESFQAWKKYAQMINAQKVDKSLKDETTDSQSSILAMQSAMMQQYPHMMMGSAGLAAYNALISQAMINSNSTAPLYPSLMQAAVSQAQHPLLSSQWQQQSIAAVQAQTQSLLMNQAQQQLLFNQSQHQQSSLSKLQSLTQVLCNDAKESDKGSMSSASPSAVSPVPPSNDNSTLKKQNKNEYLYFIYHPDVSYPDFNIHFPHISNRTFYRWKKEVKDAQALLDENPHYTYEDISVSFPNIPHDIFSQWKDKLNHPKKLSPVEAKPQVWRPHVPDYKQLFNNQKPKERNGILKAVLENDTSSDILRIPQYKPLDLIHNKFSLNDSNASTRKHRNEEQLYVQMNPTVSLSQFQVIYPDVDSQHFYKWKKEVKECLTIIYAEPKISLQKFQSLFPEVSEDLFSKWKILIESDPSLVNEYAASQISDTDYEDMKRKTPSSEDDDIEEEASADGRVYSHNRQKKQSRPEYLCLQENPFIDLQEVINSFPGVSKRTLYRWKKEILQAVEFVRGQPEISFQVFSVYFPEVLERNFHRWKNAISSAATSVKDLESDFPQDLSKASNGNKPSIENDKHRYNHLDAGTNIQEAERNGGESDESQGITSVDDKNAPKFGRKDFEYILENPDVDYEKYSKLFPLVNQLTFIKWKNEAHRWISLIMSSPSIDFNIFSIYCQDVPEDIFVKWKNIAKDKANISTNGPVNLSVPHVNDSTSLIDSDRPVSTFSNNNDTPSPCSDISKPLKNLTPRSRKVNLREYHYFLQNPYMTFQELNEIFNTISGRTFYRWKKEVKEKLEYLESKSDADFESFSKLFPDVTEDMFSTWKQKASLNAASRKATLNTVSWWNANHQRNADELKANCVSESMKEGPDMQSSGHGRNASENFEDRDLEHRSISPTISSMKRSATVDHNRDEKFSKIEPTVDEQYDDPGSTIQQMLHQYSNLSTNFHVKYGLTPSSQLYLPPPSLLPTSVASAVNQSGTANNSEVGKSLGNTAIFPTNMTKKSLSNAITTAINHNANYDEIYSPKFRKRQREEYCFLQQNPTMDFNEFTSHFPRVSIRTFYRWKKELKEEK